MEDEFASLSFLQVVERITALGGQANNAALAMKAYRRLLDIAFMDHGVSAGDRHEAEQLADVIRRDLTAAGAGSFGAAFEAAAESQREHNARFGRGTEIWDAEEAAHVSARAADDYKAALEKHLDETSETIGALAFSVHYYVAELMRLLMAKNVLSADELGELFKQLDEVMAGESSQVFRAKVGHMAQLLERTVLTRNDA